MPVLGFKAGHEGRPLGYDDGRALNMRIGECFNHEGVKCSIEAISEAAGRQPEYGVPNGAHNLAGGFKDAGIRHHLDISHTLGNCMKHVYGNDAEFMALTEMLGKTSSFANS